VIFTDKEYMSAVMINRIVNWNISSTRRWFSSADALVVSVPKSGRTWLRVFIDAYMDAITEDNNSAKTADPPRVLFTHDLWEHLTARHLWDRIRGRYLIPRRMRAERRIIFLYRDPRDVLTSLYFQLSKRSNYYQGDISGLVRHPRYGVERIVAVMNTWMAEWGGKPNMLPLSYETCKKDEARAFSSVLQFVGIRQVNRNDLDRCLEAASFDNMRKLELSGKYPSGLLRPGDPNDPESFKVRKGKIGGYVDYLSPEDIAFADRAMRALDPRFGFGK
jgi:hypothetical protein